MWINLWKYPEIILLYILIAGQYENFQQVHKYSFYCKERKHTFNLHFQVHPASNTSKRVSFSNPNLTVSADVPLEAINQATNNPSTYGSSTKISFLLYNDSQLFSSKTNIATSGQVEFLIMNHLHLPYLFVRNF